MLPIFLDWIAALLGRQAQSWDVVVKPPRPEPVEEDWGTKAGRDAIAARLMKLRKERGWLSDYEWDDYESTLQIDTMERVAEEYQRRLKIERSCCCNAWRPRWWRHNAALNEGFPKALRSPSTAAR